MDKIVLDCSVIIPTHNRNTILESTLKSIADQSSQPLEIIIIDGSPTFKKLDRGMFSNLESNIIHQKAVALGAAQQRNQGISIANSEVIGFFDDDIILQKDCIKELWKCLEENTDCGGVNAIITNQSYHPLGKVSKIFYKLMGADTSKSLAGKCIGPAINFLPELENKSDFLMVEWLNTTCTLYRKKALPKPVFDLHFTGYSLMEDLALSLRVAKDWKLFTAAKAKIFHDSQPSEGKNNLFINSEMELVNRFYIMKHIMNKHQFKDYLKLFLQQLFAGLASKKLFSKEYRRGKFSALKKLRSI